MIPAEDAALVRKHSLGLQDFWLECWEADPYGSRFVLMPIDLKKSVQRKYRRQLTELGLFLFEVRRQGNYHQLWTLNLHGARARDFWESCDAQSIAGDAHSVTYFTSLHNLNREGDAENSEGDAENSEGDAHSVTQNAKTLAEKAFQKPSTSSQDHFNILSISSGEREKEKFEFGNPEEEAKQGNGVRPQSSASLDDQMELTEEAIDQGQDQNSAAAAPAQNLIQNRDRTSERFNRPAKCEWEIKPGEPYPAFIKWRSQHYLDQGGRWAAAASANARSEIRNNPARAADLWQQFLEYSDRAATNALAARDAGIAPSLPPCFAESPIPEKEIVMRKLNALAPALNPIAPPPTTPAAISAAPAPLPLISAVPSAPIAPAPTAAGNNAPDGENSGAYQLRTAADFMGPTSEPPADWAEQIKKQMAAMAEKKSMGRRRTAAFLTERPDLDEAKRLFADPLLRPELKKALARHPDWGYEYDASQIWEMEF